MIHRIDRIATETLGALHRDALHDRSEIKRVLRAAARDGASLDAGIDRRNEPRLATIVRVDSDGLILESSSIQPEGAREYYFNVEVRGALYFFAAAVKGGGAGESLTCSLPRSLYRAERRDLERLPGEGAQVLVRSDENAELVRGYLLDRSLHGAGILVDAVSSRKLPSSFRIEIGTDPKELFASVRHKTIPTDSLGSIRLGLSVSSVPSGPAISVDSRKRLISGPAPVQVARGIASLGWHRARQRLGLSRRTARPAEIVRFGNHSQQEICGIVHGWGDPSDATTVVIPPAWGRTKESLMPLALTIVETFKRARQPIQVLRYDGTNRRGESYIDPDCRRPGDEYLHFRFSQAASDVDAAMDFMRSRSGGCRKVVLVTFSLAAVEGRHAMATAETPADGWVAVVGVADLQSALRVISGGVDYGHGLLRGIRFGRHELVGVVADMDLTGLDSIEHGIGFLEDAKRDMSRITSPVTWIHGRYDAWMDLGRVAEIMSCGSTENRKLLEVPTGHQLHSSRVAMSTFQLIAEEVSEMALGRPLRGAAPSISRLSSVREMERGRLPRPPQDVRSFWEDYLLGRDRSLGMELLTATASYRNFFNRQVQALQLGAGDRVADLGAGTGEFSLALASAGSLDQVRLIEVDFLSPALRRGRERRKAVRQQFAPVYQVAANLGISRGGHIPLETGSVDAVLASLLISYIEWPDRLLREVFRILRPGGRFVVSSMLEDADVSMLFHDGLFEFATPEARHQLTDRTGLEFGEMVRSFLNDGSRLLCMEEEGIFRFWNPDDLRYAVANAGFKGVVASVSLGEPAQAVIVEAIKP